MWSLFYTVADDSDNKIYTCGPWTTPEQALSYACENDENLSGRSDPGPEFNVERDRVYLVSPRHSTHELELIDLEAFQKLQKTPVFSFLDK